MKATRLAIRDQVTRAKEPGSASDEVVGVILNVASLVAIVSNIIQPLYCATKAGVANFTRGLGLLQKEFGIKVVAVAPGIVDTPMWSEQYEKMLGAEDVRIPPEEIADAMLHVIEGEFYPGGTVLEVLKGKTRVLHPDSPLPQGSGSTVQHHERSTQDTFALLRKEQQAGAVSRE